MLGTLCQYRRDQHRVIQPRMLKWIKRQVPGKLGDSLFIYRHLELGTHIIAMWSQIGKSFQDIVNLGLSLDNFTREVALQFVAQVKDAQTRYELCTFLKQQERNKLSEMQDENDEEVERRAYIENEKSNVKISMSGANYAV